MSLNDYNDSSRVVKKYVVLITLSEFLKFTNTMKYFSNDSVIFPAIEALD
jgi:hypothetical protein